MEHVPLVVRRQLMARLEAGIHAHNGELHMVSRVHVQLGTSSGRLTRQCSWCVMDVVKTVWSGHSMGVGRSW